MKKLARNQLADLLVLSALFCLSGWYLWDSWSASSHIYNLILVLPLTVIVMLLCAVAFVGDLLRTEAVNRPVDRDSATSSLPAIALFVGYVISLPWLGFDVGTFLFLAAFLKIAGEQKWQWILGYSLAFAFGSALFFSAMLPYPMPLLLIPGGN
ncbi:MAG: tripartite tricarboxylate transporter TctB family protein [Gammaproteobacteria bacterium]|nr:tripartite tricarboxylate transporter TctB family protein [Pseudomonadales bacterium]MCP5347909.1 tripartite tricarboxylate transporter TctB family protein [Pseudomonadales bacterium]